MGLTFVVADTHAFIYWVSGLPVLSPAAAASLDAADEVGVCSHSCLEIAWLVADDRLKLGMDVMDWLNAALSEPGVTLLPLTPAIAVTASRLRRVVGKDPADCVITATAMLRSAPLVTRDGPIRESGVVETIW